eukprot:GHUV01046795.1.p1 GENE.GHUV01046795.1~~GHUV01046795.1.p1  ORF type:complete len:162 (-),score=31.26 GHUV01046795.1:44-529(-)
MGTADLRVSCCDNVCMRSGSWRACGLFTLWGLMLVWCLLLLCVCSTNCLLVLCSMQWVDDHTHIPTLTALPKHIPIIAHPEAAERIQPLGFKSLTTIKPGQQMHICSGKLQLTATAGALVGPPWSARQNGYVLKVCGGTVVECEMYGQLQRVLTPAMCSAG